MDKQLVIALGGNALGNTPQEQKQAVQAAAGHIASLVKDGYKIVIVHGNGPQVGMINLAFELACQQNSNVARHAFRRMQRHESRLYWISSAKRIAEYLPGAGPDDPRVDRDHSGHCRPNDPAFQHPTKPVGLFYSEAAAQGNRPGERLHFRRGLRARFPACRSVTGTGRYQRKRNHPLPHGKWRRGHCLRRGRHTGIS